MAFMRSGRKPNWRFCNIAKTDTKEKMTQKLKYNDCISYSCFYDFPETAKRRDNIDSVADFLRVVPVS